MNDSNKKLAEKARKWLASPKGQDSIKKTIKEAKESSRKFKESRQIDPKMLKEAFTI